MPCRPAFAVAAFVCAAVATAHAEDGSGKPARIVVRDGIVLFDGANLDVDHLRSALAATGRQGEPLGFEVGPNAKSAYIRQVLRAVTDAGFTHVLIIGPLGDVISTPPEPTD